MTIIKILGNQSVYKYDTDITDLQCDSVSEVECFAQLQARLLPPLRLDDGDAAARREAGQPDPDPARRGVPARQAGRQRRDGREPRRPRVGRDLLHGLRLDRPFDPTGPGVGRAPEILAGPPVSAAELAVVRLSTDPSAQLLGRARWTTPGSTGRRRARSSPAIEGCSPSSRASSSCWSAGSRSRPGCAGRAARSRPIARGSRCRASRGAWASGRKRQPDGLRVRIGARGAGPGRLGRPVDGRRGEGRDVVRAGRASATTG